MQLSTDIDYKNNFFEHPELSRIIGETNTSTLIILKAEIRDNAQAVQTTLGGGENVYLGLVSSPETYQAFITNVDPYIRPENPVPSNLDPDNRLKQYQIAQERYQHAEAVRLFREVLSVERTIIQQIVAAGEPKYFRALRQPGNNKLQQTIS